MDPSSREQIFQRLAILRSEMALSSEPSWLDVFDEFVEQREFELALHVACDYFSEQSASSPTTAAVSAVVKLHEIMQIKDSCAADLRAKQNPEKPAEPDQ